MNLSKYFGLSAFTLAAIAFFIPVTLQADEWSGVPSQPSQLGGAPSASGTDAGQQRFASPEDAVKALRAAVEADDQAALTRLFGPDLPSLRTGDPVQDAKNAHHFAEAMKQQCHLEKQDDEIFIDVGTNDWPMPIPLTESNGQWYFDTAAGKEEIIDRHIGRDELAAIAVCHAYLQAQQQFASENGGVYARRFRNSPGQKDGLESIGRFGSLVAEAEQIGPDGHKGAPFHGYYFRVLTRQGSAAPGGKMDYLSDGNLKKGFALLAYPESWDHSGIMTFIVNQDGKVYQRNFGEKTSRIAFKIREYNPDKDWTLVQDQGILDGGQ